MRVLLIQSEFKLIKFNNGRKNQARKLIQDKNAIKNVVNIPGNINNCLLFKNNIEYKWTKFM